MRTEYRIDGADAWFVFVDLGEAYHEAARGLGCQPVPGGFGRRFAADSPHLARIYDTFARHAEELILQKAGERPVPWERALGDLLGKIEGHDLDWYLVGSAALAVRGLDVAPGDVDLAVDAAGAHRLADLLGDDLIEPLSPTPGWVGEWFGRAFRHACLDWIGGVTALADRPDPSDFGPTAARRLDRVTWRGHELRVPPLDLQLAVTERRRRDDRAALIRQAMGR